MPTGLKRYYGNEHLHFLTCSCYHRQPWLSEPRRRDLFLQILEEVRERYRFVVVGYVVMPDHIHLLISEPDRGTPSTVMQVLKQRYARCVLAKREARSHCAPEPSHVWQRRFYDFNVYSTRKRLEKATLHASESGEGRIGCRARAVGVEQLSQLCISGRRQSKNQSMA